MRAPPERLVRWLLRSSDPSVRWRTLTGVLGRGPNDPSVRATVRRIGREGWVARILAEQLPGGGWITSGPTPSTLYRPKYIATNWRLIVLAELGAPARDPRVQRSVELFLRTYAGTARGGGRWNSQEACFTGNAVRMLVTLGRLDDPRTRRAIDWLVRTQKPDGGWHCFPSRVGTLDAWEPLAALAAIPADARSAAVDRAVARGTEFFLDRGLLREGRGTYGPWTRLHYPNHYYYDLLVGLSMLVRLGCGSDRRLRPALDLLASKRNRDGSWNLDALHPDVEGGDRTVYLGGYVRGGPFYPFGLELPGSPSRWITTTALEVLGACGRR
jgi:hypothetical protein